jgi:hypothetical protein
MTKRLEQAFAEASKLPQQEQDAIAEWLFLRLQEEHLIHASAKLSEPAFKKAWDNPDDADYDRL